MKEVYSSEKSEKFPPALRLQSPKRKQNICHVHWKFLLISIQFNSISLHANLTAKGQLQSEYVEEKIIIQIIDSI
jgi:hypothetical protein